MSERSKKTNKPIWSTDTLRNPHDAADKAGKVKQMFDAIASRYDLANTIISFGQAYFWRKRLIRMLKAHESRPTRILDLCCGTGEMTERLRESFSTVPVVGADFSFNMLDLARDKYHPKLDRWVCGDGLSLPFAENTFDLITCVFGLRNYQSLETGLMEIHRVLRRGGKFAFLEFQPPSIPCLGVFFRFYFHHVLPCLGAWVTDSRKIGAYEYLPQSVDSWYDIETVLKMMRDCGLKELQVRKVCFGSVWAIVAEK